MFLNILFVNSFYTINKITHDHTSRNTIPINFIIISIGNAKYYLSRRLRRTMRISYTSKVYNIIVIQTIGTCTFTRTWVCSYIHTSIEHCPCGRSRGDDGVFHHFFRFFLPAQVIRRAVSRRLVKNAYIMHARCNNNT